MRIILLSSALLLVACSTKLPDPFIYDLTSGGSQNPKSETAFDHITWVSMTTDGPSIANLRFGGYTGQDRKNSIKW